MQAKERSMIVGLVQMMWADNEIVDSERELLGSILVQLGCNVEDVTEVGEMIKNPTSTDDVLDNLPTMDDRREFIKIMAVMAMVDGCVATAENTLVGKLAAKLGIPNEEMPALMEESRQLLAQREGRSPLSELL